MCKLEAMDDVIGCFLFVQPHAKNLSRIFGRDESITMLDYHGKAWKYGCKQICGTQS